MSKAQRIRLDGCKPNGTALAQSLSASILGYLGRFIMDAKSLAVAQATCRSWNGCIGNDARWQFFYMRDYGNMYSKDPAISTSGNETPWSVRYRNRRAIESKWQRESGAVEAKPRYVLEFPYPYTEISMNQTHLVISTLHGYEINYGNYDGISVQVIDIASGQTTIDKILQLPKATNHRQTEIRTGIDNERLVIFYRGCLLKVVDLHNLEDAIDVRTITPSFDAEKVHVNGDLVVLFGRTSDPPNGAWREVLTYNWRTGKVLYILPMYMFYNEIGLHWRRSQIFLLMRSTEITVYDLHTGVPLSTITVPKPFAEHWAEEWHTFEFDDATSRVFLSGSTCRYELLETSTANSYAFSSHVGQSMAGHRRGNKRFVCYGDADDDRGNVPTIEEQTVVENAMPKETKTQNHRRIGPHATILCCTEKETRLIRRFQRATTTLSHLVVEAFAYNLSFAVYEPSVRIVEIYGLRPD